MSHLIVAFGRFQGFTRGHQELLDAACRLCAVIKGSTLKIHTSKSNDKKKNPLPYDFKCELLLKYYGNKFDTEIINNGYIGILKHYSGKFDEITFVVGDDREQEITNIMNKYNHTDLFNYKKCDVVSVYRNDLISATGLRQLIRDDKPMLHEYFASFLSTTEIREIVKLCK